MQLSQALGDGKVQAEEYNSLLDGGRTILQAVAAGMDEAGGKVSALTRLVKAGKVSSKAFFDAFEAGAPILQQKLASSELTVSQHLVRLQNVLTDAARRFDESTTAVDTLGTALDGLSDFIASVDFDKLIGGLNGFLAQVDKGITKVDNLAAAIGRLTGLDNVGKALTGGKGSVDLLAGYGLPGALVMHSTKAEGEAHIQDRINEAFGTAPTKLDTVHVDAPAPTVKPITLADYPVGGSSGKKSGSGSAGDPH